MNVQICQRVTYLVLSDGRRPMSLWVGDSPLVVCVLTSYGWQEPIDILKLHSQRRANGTMAELGASISRKWHPSPESEHAQAVSSSMESRGNCEETLLPSLRVRSSNSLASNAHARGDPTHQSRPILKPDDGVAGSASTRIQDAKKVSSRSCPCPNEATETPTSSGVGRCTHARA